MITVCVTLKELILKIVFLAFISLAPQPPPPPPAILFKLFVFVLGLVSYLFH